MNLLFILILSMGEREVKASPCDVVRINLSAGMTTIIDVSYFGVPTSTLFSDKENFLVKSDDDSKNIIAIIPKVTGSKIREIFFDVLPKSDQELATRLDQTLKTNLFLLFPRNRRLMFELRFVPKGSSDYVVKVSPKSSQRCGS